MRIEIKSFFLLGSLKLRMDNLFKFYWFLIKLFCENSTILSQTVQSHHKIRPHANKLLSKSHKKEAKVQD